MRLCLWRVKTDVFMQQKSQVLAVQFTIYKWNVRNILTRRHRADILYGRLEKIEI